MVNTPTPVNFPVAAVFVPGPLRIRNHLCTAPYYILEPGIDALVVQRFGGGIGFEVLHLRPDSKLGRVERVSFQPISGDTHAAEVVLLKRDGGLEKVKFPVSKLA